MILLSCTNITTPTLIAVIHQDLPALRIPLSGDELGHVLRLLVGHRPEQDLAGPVQILDPHDFGHVPAVK